MNEKYFYATKEHSDLARVVRMIFPGAEVYWDKRAIIYTNQLMDIKKGSSSTVLSSNKHIPLPYMDNDSTIGILARDGQSYHQRNPKGRLFVSQIMITKISDVNSEFLKRRNYENVDELMEDLRNLEHRSVKKDDFLSEYTVKYINTPKKR